MTIWTKCDNCGRMQQDPFRKHGDERDALWEARKDQVLISLEHNEDDQCFDACSWACVAELALRQSAEVVVEQEGHLTIGSDGKTTACPDYMGDASQQGESRG